MDDQLRHYQSKLQYEIDPWDLNEALRRGDKILLVDTRSPEAFLRSHIPGAMNLPHRAMSNATTADLEKGALIEWSRRSLLARAVAHRLESTARSIDAGASR